MRSLTSFLSTGAKKGSLTLRPATIVKTGSRHLKIAPNMSIFPSLGSIGSTVKCRPVKWHLRLYDTKYSRNTAAPIQDHFPLPKTVKSSLWSKAPMIFKYSIAFWTYRQILIKQSNEIGMQKISQLKLEGEQ